MTASTSIGATVAACRNENHPNEAPTAPPKAVCGKRPVPPATGHMAPSSACTSARSMIARAAMPQEMIADGPAAARASCELNSQPEPMIDPPDAHSSPMKPISRRSPRGAPGSEVGAPMVLEASAAMRDPSTPTTVGHRAFHAALPYWNACLLPVEDALSGARPRGGGPRD